MSILLILIFGFLAVVSLAVAINIWGAGPGQIRDGIGFRLAFWQHVMPQHWKIRTSDPEF